MSASNPQCSNQKTGVHGFVVEAWGQGFLVGGLVILCFQTISGMKRKKLLHKLILLELLLAVFHGTYIFLEPPTLGWYTSATATPLYLSYNLHNVINWIKVKPFLPRWASILYIGTVALVFPYWVAEMYFNFTYNNALGPPYFRQTRPWEAFCREPWWFFTSIYLVVVIERCYSCGVWGLVKGSARFGVLLLVMTMSLGLIIADIVDVATGTRECAGKNPYWKIALVFKCAADAVFLDDFKTVLDRLFAERGIMTTAAPVSAAAAAPDDGLTNGISRASVPDRRSMAADKEAAYQTEDIATLPAKQSNRKQTKEWFDVVDPI